MIKRPLRATKERDFGSLEQNQGVYSTHQVEYGSMKQCGNFFKTGKFKLRLGALSVINGPSHLKSVPCLESKEALISKYSEDIYYKSTVDFLMYLVCVFKSSVINYIS